MTTARSSLGALGERLAADFLVRSGATIVSRNVRFRVGEIDLVVCQDGTLIFVEVRTRRGSSYGSPEESITAGKRRRMIAAAEAYLANLGDPVDDWRIDLIAVALSANGTLERIERFVGAIEG